jgi:hypothetical protein
VAVDVISTPTPGRIVDLSSRAFVGIGSSIAIAGFNISGTGSKKVILRGVGPDLVPFVSTGTLVSPLLSLLDTANPANLITVNSGWQNAPSAPAGLWARVVAPSDASTSDFDQVGAFGLSPGSSDSAIKVTLPTGGYTAEVTGLSGGTGIALAEVYDADAGTSTTTLENISTRAFVGTGSSILIAGFVISGSTSQTVLIRASGPALNAFGVSDTLADPQVKLFGQTTNQISSTSGWGGASQIVTAAAAVGAFPWSSPSSNDSAVLITLPPGSYTAEAAGASGDTGVALIEVYVVPPTGQ